VSPSALGSVIRGFDFGCVHQIINKISSWIRVDRFYRRFEGPRKTKKTTQQMLGSLFAILSIHYSHTIRIVNKKNVFHQRFVNHPLISWRWQDYSKLRSHASECIWYVRRFWKYILQRCSIYNLVRVRMVSLWWRVSFSKLRFWEIPIVLRCGGGGVDTLWVVLMGWAPSGAGTIPNVSKS